MHCDVCGSDDSLFVVLSGISQGETRLCKACAQAKGYLFDEGVATLPQMDSILGQLDQPVEAEVLCPGCGMAQEQLIGAGRLGCPACVQAFRRQYVLARQRRGLHSGYTGKIPRSSAFTVSSPETGPEASPELVEPPDAGQGVFPWQGSFPLQGDFESSRLLADIESAILAEDFEKAALLRDRLSLARVNARADNDT